MRRKKGSRCLEDSRMAGLGMNRKDICIAEAYNIGGESSGSKRYGL